MLSRSRPKRQVRFAPEQRAVRHSSAVRAPGSGGAVEQAEGAVAPAAVDQVTDASPLRKRDAVPGGIVEPYREAQGLSFRR